MLLERDWLRLNDSVELNLQMLKKRGLSRKGNVVIRFIVITDFIMILRWLRTEGIL